MKYPIGIQSFDRIVEDGYMYVDKTDLIYSLTHEGSIYFLSRPRLARVCWSPPWRIIIWGGRNCSVAWLWNVWKRSGRYIRYFMWISMA